MKNHSAVTVNLTIGHTEKKRVTQSNASKVFQLLITVVHLKGQSIPKAKDILQ